MPTTSSKPIIRRSAALIASVLLAIAGGLFAAAPANALSPSVSVFLSCSSSGAYSVSAVGTSLSPNTYYSTWFDTHVSGSGGSGGSWGQGEQSLRSSSYGTVSTSTFYGNHGAGPLTLQVTYHIGAYSKTVSCSW